MLERDFKEIADLQFNIELLICEPPHVASRPVTFAETVFYRFRDERIAEVRSVVDKAAIEAQL
jgi:predicted ester cyclase